MVAHYKKNWKFYHIVFILGIVVISFPNIFRELSTGVDPSWCYALNKFFSEGYVEGKDYVFTYGFLGFLVNCRNVGYNILFALCFWLTMLALHGILLYQLLCKGAKCRKAATFIGLSLYLMSHPRPEYYLAYIGLMALFLSMDGFKKDIYVFDLILVSLFYLKFSMSILMVGIVIIYLILGYFQDRKQYLYNALRMAIGILAIPLLHFAFNGFSPIYFYKYIKGSLEIASGYNVAMSYSELDRYVIFVILAAVAYMICLGLSAKCGMDQFVILSLISLCMFMLYKQGFVRSDVTHVAPSINSMLIFLSLALVFLDWTRIYEILGKWKVLFLSMFAFDIIVAVVISIILTGLNIHNVDDVIINRIFRPAALMLAARRQETADLHPLPEAVTEAVGDETVTIYPWDVAYCISNELNYVPLATIQAYSAYTPYLDEITAEKFLYGEAPKYIILDVAAIDGRWAFIECPQTWEVIRNRYSLVMEEDGVFLMQCNGEMPSVSYKQLRKRALNGEERIDLGEADYVKISAELNWKGILAKIFWKVPEVDMLVYYENGNDSGERGRIILDSLSEGAYVGAIISRDDELSTEQFADLMNQQGELSKVKAIALSGDGLSYYKDDMEIEFFATQDGRSLIKTVENPVSIE